MADKIITNLIDGKWTRWQHSLLVLLVLQLDGPGSLGDGVGGAHEADAGGGGGRRGGLVADADARVEAKDQVAFGVKSKVRRDIHCMFKN